MNIMPKRLPGAFAFETSNNPVMRKALLTMKQIAQTDLSVVITGEAGTGKEWAAYAIHTLGARSQGPFVQIECAATAEENLDRDLFGFESINWNGVTIKGGAFEEAAGGSLLLKGIESLPHAHLLKIARVMEFRLVRRISGDGDIPVDARGMATFNTTSDGPSPEHSAVRGILERISSIQIELPPLRNRREDIPMLIDGVLEELRERTGTPVKGVSEDAVRYCEMYTWPGNVRHLKNAIEYACIMSGGEVIMPGHLPAYLQRQSDNNR
jgi:two-component system, NtrC family, response regulator HydG